MTNRKIAAILLFAIANCISCRKFLSTPPDKKLAIPTSLSELQALLDDYGRMNDAYPNATEIVSDNYYVLSDDWGSVNDEGERNEYLWQKNENVADWLKIYRTVKSVNTVLDNLANIKYDPAAEQNDWNHVRGSALFFRAFYFYACSQLFAQPYVKTTASHDLGIVLRLTSDFNEPSVRASVQQTYDRIILDLKEAAALLPETELLKTRPTKAAAYGALAKTYLAMQEYDSAGKYADECLKAYGENNLLDYNTDIDINAGAPFERFNKEVIFHCKAQNGTIIANSRAKIDSTLYRSYADNDLRKIAYFKENTGDNAGTYQFKGDYDGSGSQAGFTFGGIVTDEMYLIRAESHARKGEVQAAMADLNTLMQRRWKSGYFTPFTASDANEALLIILRERRKELLFRGTRWTDLRRLMTEPQFATTLTRIINNTHYDLLPNGAGYTLQIPIKVIEITGMPQNP